MWESNRMRRWLCDSWFFHTIKYVKKRRKEDIQASATTLRLLRFDKRNRTKTALSSFGFHYHVQQNVNVQKHCKYLWFVQVEKYTHVRTKSYRLTNSITYFRIVTLGSHSHIITIYSNVVFHFFCCYSKQRWMPSNKWKHWRVEEEIEEK